MEHIATNPAYIQANDDASALSYIIVPWAICFVVLFVVFSRICKEF